jgi:peptidoglycan-N-acetylmuramic acid deacetylase
MAKEKILMILLAAVFFILSSLIMSGLFSNQLLTVSSQPEYMWYYLPHEQGMQPEPMEKAPYLKDHIKNHDVYYAGSPLEKVIYITFDDCPSNGNIPAILGVLEKHNATAAFFMTEKYIENYPDVIKRITDDGCLICNHTADHICVTRITLSKFESELKGVEDAFKKATGRELQRYFRPPQGMFNEDSLDYTQQLGYITVLWSFRYTDWDVANQPSESSAIKTILKETHPGEIALLHCQSKTNVKILDSVLDAWEELGYSFKSLDYLTGGGDEECITS